MPPTCWKNDRLLTAEPIWRTGTLFWTMSGNTANIGPTPRPVTSIASHSSGSGVSARSCVSTASPTAVVTSAANVIHR